MAEARIFIVALPDLQKIGMNKTIGRQYVWGQDQTNCIIKAVKDKKIIKMTKKMVDIVVAVIVSIRQGNRQHSLHQKGSGYSQ
jgi:hypothetical protein